MIHEDWSFRPVFAEVAVSATRWKLPDGLVLGAAYGLGHGKPRYDVGLDMIRGDLVAEGKRPEGKHRKRHST